MEKKQTEQEAEKINSKHKCRNPNIRLSTHEKQLVQYMQPTKWQSSPEESLVFNSVFDKTGELQNRTKQASRHFGS